MFEEYPTFGVLVTLKVYLIGGHTLEVTDAFRARNEQEARNMAINIFITGNGMIMYGVAAIVLDAVAAIEVVGTTFINLDDPANEHWLRAIEVFENFMESQDVAQEEDRPVAALTGFGHE